jgi:hypothetical protein
LKKAVNSKVSIRLFKLNLIFFLLSLFTFSHSSYAKKRIVIFSKNSSFITVCDYKLLNDTIIEFKNFQKVSKLNFKQISFIDNVEISYYLAKVISIKKRVSEEKCLNLPNELTINFKECKLLRKRILTSIDLNLRVLNCGNLKSKDKKRDLKFSIVKFISIEGKLLSVKEFNKNIINRIFNPITE